MPRPDLNPKCSLVPCQVRVPWDIPPWAWRGTCPPSHAEVPLGHQSPVVLGPQGLMVVVGGKPENNQIPAKANSPGLLSLPEEILVPCK